jgi:hypothetical protein
VADWADLPEWQRLTDCDIFDVIESATAGSDTEGSATAGR